MKIAFIGGRLSRRASGVKVVLEHLSAALVRQGHDVRVFGLEDAAWHQGDCDDWTGGRAEVFATRGPAAFGYAPGLWAAVRDFAPDVVHSHGLWMYGSVVSAGLARSGVPNVVSPHGMLDRWALLRSRMRKLVATGLFERGHLSGASCIHSLNAAEAGAVRDFGINGPVAVLPNGVDLPLSGKSEFGPPDWRAALPEEARVLLYLGRLHPKKNLAALIAAWPEVPSTWHLVIAGPDSDGYLATLQAQIARQAPEVSQRVHFSGPQFGIDKSATLASADAFVLPSLSEGLPMAVLEAWAHCLPVAMTSACNLAEGFAEGAAVEIGTNTDEIRRGLEAFFALSAEEHALMGRKGHAFVKRDYSWDHVASSFVALYDWARDGKRRTAPTFVSMDEGERRV